MLKERHHRHGVAAATPRTSRRTPRAHRTGSVMVPPAAVGIIPGSRFFLLPLKKVTALVRPHTPCRDPSATSTKPCIRACIVTKAAATTSSTRSRSNHVNIHGAELQFARRQALHSRRLVVKHKHHRLYPAVARTRLSPVSELAHGEREPSLVELDHQENWLWNDQGNYSRRLLTHHTSSSSRTGAGEWQHRSRSKDISIFSLNKPRAQRLEPGLESRRTRIRSQGAQASSSFPPGSPQAVSNLSVGHTTVAKKKFFSSTVRNVSGIDAPSSSRSTSSLTKSRFSTTSPESSDHALRDQQLRVRAAATSTLPKVGRTFGRNNRVSPSSSWPHHQSQFKRDSSFATSQADQLVVPPRKRRNRTRAACSALSHQIRSTSPFLCSFTNANDLPLGPTFLRRSPTAAAQVEVQRLIDQTGDSISPDKIDR